MLNGALQVVEGLLPTYRPRFPKLHHVFSVLFTDFLILITMLVFRAGSLGTAIKMLIKIPQEWGTDPFMTEFSAMQALCLGVCVLVLFAIELIHEKRCTLTELTDKLPGLARMTLYLAALMAIIIFGVWGPGYTAQAFIYFQF